MFVQVLINKNPASKLSRSKVFVKEPPCMFTKPKRVVVRRTVMVL